MLRVEKTERGFAKTIAIVTLIVAGILAKMQQFCTRQRRGGGGAAETRTWPHGDVGEDPLWLLRNAVAMTARDGQLRS